MDDHTMKVEAYLKDRVEKQLRYYEHAANKAQRTHIALQTTIITLGIVVSVAINVPTQ